VRTDRGERRGAAGGFTLLELMLAMVALAMLSAICYAAFHLGIRAVERGEVAVVTAQRLRVASDVLIRQVKSAVPYAARNDDDEVYPYFFGTPTSMTFITAAGLDGGGSLARVSYRLEQDPPRLVLEESSFFNPDGLGRKRFEPVAGRSAVILDGFKDLHFQYLLNDGADVEWKDAWDARDEEMLPQAVRIIVDGMPGIEGDVWGQEIPIMVTTYNPDGGGGEADEDSLQDRVDPTGVGGNGTPDSGGPEEPDVPDEGPDE
jgi:type II secretion system protein J